MKYLQSQCYEKSFIGKILKSQLVSQFLIKVTVLWKVIHNTDFGEFSSAEAQKKLEEETAAAGKNSQKSACYSIYCRIQV